MVLRLKGRIPAILRVLFVFILVLLQVGIMIMLVDLLRKKASVGYMFVESLGVVAIFLLVDKKGSWNHKLGWIVVIILLPVTGYIMYLLWGSSFTNKSINKKINNIINRGQRFQGDDDRIVKAYRDLSHNQFRIAHYLENRCFPIYDHTKIEYFSLGDTAFEQIIKDMKNAEKYIFIEFFIIAEGQLWNRIHEVLTKKVQQGVEVKIIYDDWGSIITVDKGFASKLREEGIEVNVFNPVHRYLSKLYMNYRNHQKIIVIDGNIAYTGGINLADEYVNYYPKHGHWKDQAIRLTGAGVYGLVGTFLEMWEVASGKIISDYSVYRGKINKVKGGFCQPFSDGPANNPDNPAKDTIMQIINSANDILYITTPYLVIDNEVLEALELAAKSGVDVRIITPNIPDHKYVQYITRHNYGELLKAGVKIFEYTPGFIHSKMVLNEETIMIGSINLDYRSFYLHYECGVVAYQTELIEESKKDFLDTINISSEVTFRDWKKTPFYIKIAQLILNLFSGLM